MTTPSNLMRFVRCTRPTFRRGVAAILCSSLLAQSACFAYRPASAAGVSAGTSVRIELTDGGRVSLEPMLGARVRSLTGQIQEILRDSSAVVLIDQLQAMDGEMLTWRRGRISIPLRDVASVEERRIDRKRTWSFAAIAGATFIGVIVTAIKRAGSSGSASGGRGGGPPE